MSKKNTILVTGGAGFIGSEFVRQLVDDGQRIVVLDKLTYAGDLERLKNIKGKFEFVKADIADVKKTAAAFKKHKPQTVVHFAAETHVDRSILDAQSHIVTNVIGTQVLVEEARKVNVSKFVHISTDEVYGDIEEGKFYETTPLNPSSPYSAAKASGDLLINAYRRTYQFPAIIIRPSNNYGPWQYPEKFMPVIIYKALTNQKIPVYGKGLNVREWLYVSDCAKGIYQVMLKGKLGEAYNIGSGNERPNIDVVKTVLAILRKGENLIEYVADRPGHDIRYCLDYQKLQNEVGYKPEVPFEEGVHKTIDFYKRNFKWLESKVKELKSYWKKVYKKA